MMFVHATGMADLNTLTNNAKTVLDNLASLQQQNSTAGTTASDNEEATSSPGAEQGPGPGLPTGPPSSGQ